MAACRRRSAAWRNSLRTNRTSRSMRRLSVRWRGRSKCVGPAPWGNKSSIRGRHSVYIDQNHKWLRDRTEQWIRGAGDGEVPRGFRRRQFCARLRKDAAAWNWYVPKGRGRRAEGMRNRRAGWGPGARERRKGGAQSGSGQALSPRGSGRKTCGGRVTTVAGNSFLSGNSAQAFRASLESLVLGLDLEECGYLTQFP